MVLQPTLGLVQSQWLRYKGFFMFFCWLGIKDSIKCFLKLILPIDLIKKEFNSKHPYAFVIKCVQQLIHRNWVVKVQHVFCEGNRAADFLASRGHEVHLGCSFYDFPPIGLDSVLRDDLAEVSFSRHALQCFFFFLGLLSPFKHKKKNTISLS